MDQRSSAINDESGAADAVEPQVILVVDDHSAVRQVFQLGLERAGFEVLPARNGLEAISVFQEHESRIDLVMLDFELPYLRGDAVVREIRAHDQDMPIILCTSYADWELAELFDLATVTAVLTKPCTLAEVIGGVRATLQR